MNTHSYLLREIRSVLKLHRILYFYTNMSFEILNIAMKCDLNCRWLVYMFSLRFSGSKFLITYGSDLVYVDFFRVRKIFRTQFFKGFAVFSFCV